MKTIKQWLCFLLCAGHDYEIMDAGPTSATVKCLRCHFCKRM